MFKSGSWNASVEDRISSLDDRINDYDSEDLLTRISTAESTLLEHADRIDSLEDWRSNKASAIANESNIAVSTSIATGVITLGLQAPLASSIESNINAVKTELNNMKSKINLILGSLRTRELINA